MVGGYGRRERRGDETIEQEIFRKAVIKPLANAHDLQD